MIINIDIYRIDGFAYVVADGDMHRGIQGLPIDHMEFISCTGVNVRPCSAKQGEICGELFVDVDESYKVRLLDRRSLASIQASKELEERAKWERENIPDDALPPWKAEALKWDEQYASEDSPHGGVDDNPLGCLVGIIVLIVLAMLMAG